MGPRARLADVPALGKEEKKKKTKKTKPHRTTPKNHIIDRRAEGKGGRKEKGCFDGFSFVIAGILTIGGKGGNQLRVGSSQIWIKKRGKGKRGFVSAPCGAAFQLQRQRIWGKRKNDPERRSLGFEIAGGEEKKGGANCWTWAALG